MKNKQVLKKMLILPALFLFLLSACVPAQQTNSPNTETALTATLEPLPTATAIPTQVWDREGWTLVWHDEFEGDSINPENWAFDIGGSGWGNNEWQFYSDRPENARVEEGMLVIEAREEEYIRRDYTSARITTQGLHTFTYGRFEARLKLPYGQGIWPAFWMLGADIDSAGWPGSGEIDIMEHIGKQPTHVYATVHGPGYSGGGGVGHFTTFPSGSLSEDFHVFAIEWDEESIRWFVDEEEYFQITPASVPGKWVYDHPFFLILNLAVGGNWPGYPDETTQFPQFFVVDYVRVYQRSDQSGGYQSNQGEMHVENLQVEVVEGSDETWQAFVTIQVTDADGLAVEGAKVSGGWVGAVTTGEKEGLTDADGYLRLASNSSQRPGDVSFCVTGLTHYGYTYNKSENQLTCGKVER